MAQGCALLLISDGRFIVEESSDTGLRARWGKVEVHLTRFTIFPLSSHASARTGLNSALFANRQGSACQCGSRDRRAPYAPPARVFSAGFKKRGHADAVG